MKSWFMIGIVTALAMVCLNPAYAGGYKQSQKTGKVEVSGTEAKIIDLLLKKGIITPSEANELKGELITEKQKERAEIAKSIKDKTQAIFKVPQISSDKMQIGGEVKFKNANYRGHKTDRTTTASGRADYDTFETEAEFYLKGNVTPEWKYKIKFNNSLSNDSHLRDAWIQYTEYPYALLTAGQFKVPFSEEQLAGEDTIETAEVIDTLTSGRDIGVQISGNILDGKVDYALGVFNGNGINTTDDNDQKDIIGRIVVSPFKGNEGLLDGLSVGIAGQGGRQPNSTSGIISYAGDRTRVGGLVKYVGNIADKNFKLQSEYIYQSRDQQNTASRYISQGWYALAMYELTPKWQPLYKYEVYDADEKSTGDRRITNTVGIKYIFNKYINTQVNYRMLKYPNSKGGQELLTQLVLEF